jgi:hypothetical protein
MENVSGNKRKMWNCWAEDMRDEEQMKIKLMKE